MRIRPYQEGLITAEEFWEICGGMKVELNSGLVVGLRERWTRRSPDWACGCTPATTS